MQRKCYLACYDISEEKRRKFFRYIIKNHSVSGQYSAYECWLTAQERQNLIHFMLNNAILGEDGCAVVRVGSVYWQNLPKSPVQHNDDNAFLYIG